MNNIRKITQSLRKEPPDTVETLSSKILAQTARIMAQSALSLLVQAIELLVSAKRHKEAEEFLAAARDIKFTSASL